MLDPGIVYSLSGFRLDAGYTEYRGVVKGGLGSAGEPSSEYLVDRPGNGDLIGAPL